MSRHPFFISYAHAQHAWVRVLHANLERCLGEGTVFLDQHDLAGGVSFVGGLEAALAQAERVVLVATPEALASPWVRREVKSRQVADPLAELDGRLQIAMTVKVELPPFLTEIQAIDFTKTDAPSYRAAIATLVHELTRGRWGDRSLPDGVDVPSPPHATLPSELRARITKFLAAKLDQPIFRVGMASTLGIDPRLVELEAQPLPCGAASALLVHGARKMADSTGIGSFPSHERPFAAQAAVLRTLGPLLPAIDEQEIVGGFIAEIETLRVSAPDSSDRTDPFAAYHRIVTLDRFHVSPIFEQRAAFAELGRINEPLAMRGKGTFGERLKNESFRHLVDGSMSLGDLLAIDRSLLPSGAHRWVALGDPGSGKTTLLRHFAVELADAAGARGTPVALRLPTVLGARGPFAPAIGQVAAQGVPVDGLGEALATKARAGGIVFLLDGLDEVSDKERGAVRKWIHALADSYPEAPIVVASRRVPYDRVGAGFEEVEVQPFDPAKRQRFLEKWFANSPQQSPAGLDPTSRARALLSRLEADRALEELSGNPLYLSLIALLVDSGGSLRQGRSALYDDVLGLLIRGDHRPEERPIKSPKVVKRALVVLATALTEANRDGEAKDDLEDRLRRHDGVCADLDTVKRWRDDAGVFLEDVKSRTGIFGPLGEGEEWRFGHRTFRESLVAECLAQVWRRGGQDEVIARAKTIGGDLSAWAEAFALLAGKELVEDPDALILALADARPEVALSALASAPEVAPETVAKVVGLSDDWQERAKAYLRIPDQIADPPCALRLLDTLRLERTDGNDLYFLYAAIERLRAMHPDLAVEIDSVQRSFFDHMPLVEEHRALFEEIETKDQGETPVFVDIPEGEFIMGDAKSPHEDEQSEHHVAMVAGFCIARVTVTNAQYRAFDPDHMFEPRDGVAKEDLLLHPAVKVSWYAARSFCRWLGAVVPRLRGIRLPSEEEWEYACRAGSQAQYCSGDGEKNLAKVGWYDGNSGNRTHRVARLQPNAWGLYDTHGDVWEWTASLWDAELYANRADGFEHDASSYETPADSAGDAEPTRGAPRVIRGGSCWNDANWARSACRIRNVPRDANPFLGFRVVVPSPCSDA